MATVSERARKLHEALDELLYSQPTESVALIEQALLAERRLAMEEAAKIAAKVRDDRRMEYTGREIATTYNDGLMFGTEVVEQALRAAAEKEVGTK